MGLGRWWITHGPGSPGSVAKAMARAYDRIRTAYPSASKVEVLAATLRSRYSDRELDNDALNRIVNECGGSLSRLTLAVIHREIRAATGAMYHAPSAYMEMVSVVHEVTQTYAPGA
jgi:hypothetical protein